MIELQNVTKTHHRGDLEVHALRGVSGTIDKGTFTFILGPSGSGKSTLLYMLGALDEPTSGEILVEGQKLSALSEKQRDQYRRSQIGFIFQSFNLLSNMTALENVLVPYMPVGVTAEQRDRARALLEQVGLSQRMDHRPGQLSGGEQQRVAIARAILKRPMLILADEPTGELDTKTGEEVFGHLRRMHEQEQVTIVVVTHDSRYITPQDSILRMQDGLVVEK